MQEFLDAIRPVKENLETVKLSRKEITLIRELVIKSLKLRNVNELRDRFEGVQFYNNFLGKIAPIIVLEKIIESRLIELNSIQPKAFEPILHIENNSFHFVTSDYGEIPALDTTKADYIILAIKKDENSFWLLGKIKSSELPPNGKPDSFSAFQQISSLQDLIS